MYFSIRMVYDIFHTMVHEICIDLNSALKPWKKA